MNLSCIKAISRKDAVQAVRNRLVLLALFSGILFSAVYYILPSTVEETFTMAIYGDPQMLEDISELEEEGIEVDFFPSEEDIKDVVGKGDYMVGIAFPEDFISQLRSGQKPHLTLYFKSDQPESMRTAIENLMQLAIGYFITGEEPLIVEEEILGEDMAGRHIPLREQSVAMYLCFALIMEMWTISTLIVEESAAGTLRAVLVTPASPSDIITAKGLVGISYALIVAFAILFLTWSVRGNVPVLIGGIFLGGVMAVSLGLFLGSLTKNIVGSYVYAGAIMLILIVPALLILIPDISLSVVKLIPTYYMVDAFNQILNYGAGLAEVWKDYVIIAASDVTFFILGIFALRRQYS
ncbi:MAG: ABC transporter permease [Theionarchaea archaeon]|nr:ABC transporter permease [Theionarchaea archaeon]